MIINCLYCDAILHRHRRLKKDMSGDAFTYYHCDKCNLDFDDEKYTITIDGDSYERTPTDKEIQ